MDHYDVVICGGGLAGAALGKVLAGSGVRTLILEREAHFRDRVRGEALEPWGVPELGRLGLDAAFAQAGAVEVPFWNNGRTHRDLRATTPAGRGFLNFYHPAMQEALLAAAADAGAVVERGRRVSGVTPGSRPRVSFAANGTERHVQGDLVVGADGRASRVRRWAGFARRQDPPYLTIAGLLLAGMALPGDTSLLLLRPDLGAMSIVFPQGQQRCRLYFAAAPHAPYPRLSGARDVARLLHSCTQLGLPPEAVAGAAPAGPLASFDGAPSWVEHPYRDGVVLIGDAAASSDPAWGCGLSRTLRDVRFLAGHIAATGDLRQAAAAYARDHDEEWERLHRLEAWVTELLFSAGPQADARRARAFQAMQDEPQRAIDIVGLGPDQPAGEEQRRRYFAEDLA